MTFRDIKSHFFSLTQIADSVNNSRRVIIFLSSNFHLSDWCKYEFKMAQINGFNEQRNRVIVILDGEIEELDKLDEEIKSYLTMHLYIKWGDPWFWQKLRYAMPHRRRVNDKEIVQTKETVI